MEHSKFASPAVGPKIDKSAQTCNFRAKKPPDRPLSAPANECKKLLQTFCSTVKMTQAGKLTTPDHKL